MAHLAGAHMPPGTPNWGLLDQHKILDLVPARETPLEPVNSSLYPPPRFTVLDILTPPASPGLAAAPV
jgi:hypothetical protein